MRAWRVSGSVIYVRISFIGYVDPTLMILQHVHDFFAYVQQTQESLRFRELEYPDQILLRPPAGPCIPSKGSDSSDPFSTFLSLLGCHTWTSHGP
jgi:hypothetical protein